MTSHQETPGKLGNSLPVVNHTRSCCLKCSIASSGMRARRLPHQERMQRNSQPARFSGCRHREWGELVIVDRKYTGITLSIDQTHVMTSILWATQTFFHSTFIANGHRRYSSRRRRSHLAQRAGREVICFGKARPEPAAGFLSGCFSSVQAGLNSFRSSSREDRLRFQPL